MLYCHIGKTKVCLREEKDKEVIRGRVAGDRKDDEKEDGKGEAVDAADTCEETCRVMNFKSSFGSEARGFDIAGSHNVARKISGNISQTCDRFFHPGSCELVPQYNGSKSRGSKSTWSFSRENGRICLGWVFFGST